jgi:hypothetical protein
MTRCPPSLHRLLPGAVRLLHGYCGDTPTPAARPALLEDVGRYHGCAWHFAPARRRRSAGGPGGLGSAPPLADRVSVEADRSPRFPGNPRGGPLGSWTPAGPVTPGRYGMPTRPPPVSRTWAPATKAFGARSPSSTTSLSTLRSRGLPRTTQDSLPTAGRALSGGIGYPQGSDERFPSCTRYISSPLPELTWRNDTTFPGAQYQELSRKLPGHFAYYGGLIGNLRCLQRFRYEVVRLWRKWLSRRTRRGSWSWARLNQLLTVLVLPWPRGWVPPCVVKP